MTFQEPHTRLDSGSAIAPAELRRRECAIRQLRPADYEWVFEGILMDPLNLMTYRLGGVPPAPEALGEILWAGVSSQWVITSADRDHERYGLITFYDRDDHAQRCGVSVAFAAPARSVGWPWSGVGLAIDHWFRVTRVNKLWIEVPGWNVDRSRPLSAFGFEAEGVLREHDYLDGRPWDRYLFALFRARWVELESTRRAYRDLTSRE